jgi:uncharacterized protein (DUF305 family)
MHSNFRPTARAVLFAFIGAAGATCLAADPGEAQFVAENKAAMTKMMSAMEITPSGDVDHDFVAMMIPHHQAAVDMARAELRYGHDEQLRRLAQDIIAAQTREIGIMGEALGQPLPSAAPSPAQSMNMQ